MPDSSSDILETDYVKVIETNVSRISLRKDGIIESMDYPVAMTEANVRPIFEAFRELTQGQKMPFFIDPSSLPSVTSSARKSAIPVINECMSAMAMINHTPLSNLILKLLLTIDGVKIPVKTFKNKDEAIMWLRHFT